MLRQLFAGFQILHVVLLIGGAIGLFGFWMRTRFWLPKYAHILAAIASLVEGLVRLDNTKDAPINKAGTIGKALLALVVPAMVYFFFLFYGGQRAAFRRKPKLPMRLRTSSTVS